MKNNLLFLVALILTGSSVTAQVLRNTAESSQNRKAIELNEAQLERDIKELTVFKAQLAQFDIAFANKEIAKVATLQSELLQAMEREVWQGEQKIAQDKQEVNQSQSEVSASNRESRRSRFDRATRDNDGKDGRDVRDDRRDKKDDQRDVVDDKSDLERQIARTRRQKEILAVLKAYTFSFDPSLAEKAVANKALFQEFTATMERDIAATTAEMEEDKREAAEDSRERREDRRERVEKRKTKNG